MLLDGKHGLVLGIANKRSIAWGIAQAAHREGARLAVTYQGERLEENVRELAPQLRDPLVLPCDVTKDEDLDGARGLGPKEAFGGLDFVVHAVAFALRDELDGEFVEHLTRGLPHRPGHLLLLAHRPRPRDGAAHGGPGGSIVTLSYLGGERVVPHYNVMGVAKAALEMSVRYLAADLGPKGIRVNAISAGPIKTLAASGVHGLSKMLEYHRTHAPLRTDHRPGGGGRRRALPRLPPVPGGHRGGDPRGRRLPRHGHGGPLGGLPPLSGKHLVAVPLAARPRRGRSWAGAPRPGPGSARPPRRPRRRRPRPGRRARRRPAEPAARAGRDAGPGRVLRAAGEGPLRGAGHGRPARGRHAHPGRQGGRLRGPSSPTAA